MIDISIIIPVYNSEKYITKTVASILKQSFSNFELFLIDDGSTDGSGQICDKLRDKDSRIKVIHKKNEGICATRNKGLALATGKYIAFCDNDDFFLDNLLRDNFYLAERYDADVVRFGRRRTDVCNGKLLSVRETTNFENCYILPDQFAEKYQQINNAGEGVWAGLYKKEFLKRHEIRFNESMKYGYEDLYFITQIYMHHPSIVLNNKVYYHWIMRTDHSTSAKTNINNIESLMICLDQKWHLYEEYGMENTKVDIWLRELSSRICQVVKYVGPKKTNMSLRERMKILRYFGTCQVFQKPYTLREIYKVVNKAGIGASLIYFLFVRKRYFMLYSIVNEKSRLLRGGYV